MNSEESIAMASLLSVKIAMDGIYAGGGVHQQV